MDATKASGRTHNAHIKVESRLDRARLVDAYTAKEFIIDDRWQLKSLSFLIMAQEKSPRF